MYVYRSLLTVGVTVIVFAIAAAVWGQTSLDWNAFFAASGWLALLAKVVVEEIRIEESQVLAKQKTLLEYIRQLNDPPFSGLIQLYRHADANPEAKERLSTEDEFSIEDRTALAAEFEEMFLASELSQVSFSDIKERYEIVVRGLWRDPLVNAEFQKKHIWWSNFNRFYDRVKPANNQKG